MKHASALAVDPDEKCTGRTNRPRLTVAERFWSHVDKSGGCWVWAARVNDKGYGTFGIGSGKSALAHRVSWAMANGEIPPGVLVRHSNECVSRACVRPDHLRLGTQKENMDDRRASGRPWFRRVSVGTQRWNSKLTEWVVAEIRREWSGGKSASSIAKERGLSSTTVDKVVNFTTWRHVG